MPLQLPIKVKLIIFAIDYKNKVPTFLFQKNRVDSTYFFPYKYLDSLDFPPQTIACQLVQQLTGIQIVENSFNNWTNVTLSSLKIIDNELLATYSCPLPENINIGEISYEWNTLKDILNLNYANIESTDKQLLQSFCITGV